MTNKSIIFLGIALLFFSLCHPAQKKEKTPCSSEHSVVPKKRFNQMTEEETDTTKTLDPSEYKAFTATLHTTLAAFPTVILPIVAEYAYNHSKYYPISQTPTSKKQLYQALKTTLSSFPTVLVSVINEFAYEHVRWFLPHMNPSHKSCQRNKQAYDGSEIEIFGVHNNLPLVHRYEMSKESTKSVHLPPLWDKEQLTTDLQNALGISQETYLVPSVSYFDCVEALTPKVNMNCRRFFRLLSYWSDKMSLEKIDSPAVLIGQSNSLSYMLVSPQDFAKAYKNYHTYLEEERARHGRNFTDRCSVYGPHFDTIMSHFPHELIDRLIEDETGTFMPVIYGGGTLEQCIEKFK